MHFNVTACMPLSLGSWKIKFHRCAIVVCVSNDTNTRKNLGKKLSAPRNFTPGIYDRVMLFSFRAQLPYYLCQSMAEDNSQHVPKNSISVVSSSLSLSLSTGQYKESPYHAHLYTYIPPWHHTYINEAYNHQIAKNIDTNWLAFFRGSYTGV